MSAIRGRETAKQFAEVIDCLKDKVRNPTTTPGSESLPSPGFLDFNELRARFLAAYQDTVLFDFGDLYKLSGAAWEDLANYATDLHRFSLLKSPFPNVCYSFETTCEGEDAASSPRTRQLACVMDRGEVWDIIHASFKKGKLLGIIFGSADKMIGQRIWLVGYVPVNGHLGGRPTHAVVWESLDKFGVLTAMLSAEGIKQDIVKPPRTVQRIRASKGASPLNETRIVTIDVGGKRYSCAGESIGDKKSPRLHWRRGHIRRLASGRLINVRPALIGYRGAGVIEHSGYEVRRPR